ncbi:MAG: hypothetical protein ACE5QW_08780 [Thermoplasmata archaeon]
MCASNNTVYERESSEPIPPERVIGGTILGAIVSGVIGWMVGRAPGAVLGAAVGGAGGATLSSLTAPRKRVIERYVPPSVSVDRTLADGTSEHLTGPILECETHVG